MLWTTFITIDWGTTNRRAYRIEHGVVADSMRDDRGAASVAAADYPAAVDEVRARLGDHPMLLAGMVGSTIGWRTVPYRDLPAGLGDLASGSVEVADRVWIVPGLARREPADVMRGEEVQLLGAVAAGLAPADALLCQPGTHCKWATMRDGKVADFETAMTGELFALLRGHSILRPQLGGDVIDGDAFRAGVAEGARGRLTTSLFNLRARAVLHGDEDAAARASGLLIGADVAHRTGGGLIHVLAERPLGALYVAAIETLGGAATPIDVEPAFIAGMIGVQELLP